MKKVVYGLCLLAFGYLSMGNATTRDVSQTKTPLSANPSLVEWDSEGFSIRTKNGDNELRLGFLLQADQDIFFNTEGLTINDGVDSRPVINRTNVDRIWVRRARPILSGHLLKYNNFVFVPDFGQGQTRLFDAAVDVHYIKWLAFMAGKQISLLAGLQQFKDQSTLFSMEPGYATNMAPNREIGFLLHGQWGPTGQLENDAPYVDQRGFREWFSYQLGMFSGTADNTNPGLNPTSATAFSTETAALENKAVEARLFSNPFLGCKNVWLRGLGVGFATGVDNPTNEANLPAILSVGQNPIFTYSTNAVANGHRYRFHPQGYWFIGPGGVVVDWGFTAQHILNQTLNSPPTLNTTSLLQHNHAGEIQLVYNLTGETLDFMEKIIPLKPFNPNQKGAFGALQLVGRWSTLSMSSNVFNAFTMSGDSAQYVYADPRTSVSYANTFSVGVNWILNQYVRIVTEYDQTSFIGGCSTGALSASVNPGCLTGGAATYLLTSRVLNRPDEKTLMQRVQVQF